MTVRITPTPGAPGLRLLITGANGQVGWNLQRTLAPLGEVIALTRDQLDLADLDAVTQTVRDYGRQIVVNAAAYTAVDKAESEPELAHTVNALAPARMAAELAQSGGTLIHYSTDYVFDGSKTGAYVEDDATGPLNVYGRTKLEGEQAIIATGCAHVILRTSWVYDIRGKNFLRTVLAPGARKGRAAHGGRSVWRADLGAHHRRGHGRDRGAVPAATRRTQMRNERGLFHLTAAGQTSWAGFAKAIVEEYDDCCSLAG